MVAQLDLKTKQSRATPFENGKKDALGFIGKLKEELRKVSWTTKEELKTCTKVVVGATFVFGLGIYVIDLVIKGFLQSLSFIFYRIFG